MSRAKGPNAQAGAPRWRNEPDQDAYDRSQGHQFDGGYEDDAYTQQPQSHFPHHAFRQVHPEREQQPALSRGSLASLLNRTAPAHSPPPAEERRRPAQQAPLQRWSGNSDPAGYDLANYTPEQGHGRHAPTHDPYPQQGYDSAAAEGWTGGQWNGQPDGHQQQGYAQGSLDDLAYDPRAGYDDQGQHDYGYDGEELEEAPARRGPRAMVVIGALVGAIAVGGGLAYGYKSFNGGSDGKTPLVRADKGPAKAKPLDPGGKDIAHTDKRFLNRLGEDRPPGTIVETGASGSDRAATSDSDSSGAPRKVTTLVVNRDGSMGAANPVITPTQRASAGGGNSGSGVPGLFVEGLGGSQPQRPPLRGTASAESQGTQTEPVAPRVISRAEPIVEAKPDPKPDSTPEVRVPVKKAAPRDDYVAPQAQSTKVASAANTAVPVATGGSGYVPVLSSQKSRMDALKAFADMQQKYTDVLQGRAPDVREVDLGQKGVWHRLMLGPPGSREAANNLCVQLKAHGYTGCWITSY
jgi:hypothetical protein